jgi:hypothetical protein
MASGRCLPWRVVCACSYLPGVHETAKQHLEQLEGSRKMFVAANSLSIAQRQLLYAHDELSMALLRITTRREVEQVGNGSLGCCNGVLWVCGARGQVVS